MKHNIKCGNSLIGSDIYDSPEMQNLSRAEKRRINVFDWGDEYPEIMKNGGFDCVVGNPPYVRPHNIPEIQKRFLWNKYTTIESKSDIYACFIEKGSSLLSHNGLFGYIVPLTWTSLESFYPLRKIVVEKYNIVELVQLDKKVFDNATVSTMIFILNKKYAIDNRIKIKRILKNDYKEIREFEQKEIFDNHLYNLELMTNAEFKLILNRMKKVKTELLENLVEFKYGLKTGDDSKFISNISNNDQYKKIVRSRNIGRYNLEYIGEYVKYDPQEMVKNKKTARPGDKERFESPKIVVGIMGKTIESYYDEDNFYVKDGMLLLSNNENYGLAYITGVINSKLINYYYKNFFITINVLKNAIFSIPIPQMNLKNKNEKLNQDKMTSLVKKMLSLHKEKQTTRNPSDLKEIEREIKTTDKKIDNLVYELYGLTDEEIAIVEKTFSNA